MRITLTRDLDQLRAAAIARIDQAAAQARAVLLPDPALAEVHRRKAEAAREFVRVVGPVPALLAAEIGITGADADAVADVILAKAEALDRALAMIEARRMRAKAAVRAATTPAAIEAAAATE